MLTVPNIMGTQKFGVGKDRAGVKAMLGATNQAGGARSLIGVGMDAMNGSAVAIVQIEI